MPKDKWDKIGVVGGIIGGILVPAAIFFVGYFLSEAEKEHSRLSTQAANLTGLIGHLASTNPQQQQIATEVAGYLASKGQLPEELTPSLLRLIEETPNADTARSATKALLAAAQSNAVVQREVQQQFAENPPRVYFHISTERQRSFAREVAAKLQREHPDLVVPSIELKRGPNNTELRYYRSSEKEEAERINSALKAAGLEAKLVDLTTRYEVATGIRPKQFELWMGVHR